MFGPPCLFYDESDGYKSSNIVCVSSGGFPAMTGNVFMDLASAAGVLGLAVAV